MLDVDKRLKQLSPYHLPPGFDAKKGVAKIFAGKRPCGMSELQGMVFSFGSASAATPSGEVSGTCLLMADMCGNWFFDFYISTEEGSSGTWGAGFVFDYSDDGVGHGYTATGPYDNGDDLVGCTSQSISGSDPWISSNWFDLVAQGFRMGIGNDTGGSPPDIVSYTLEGSGFSTLQSLGGAQPSPISQGVNVDGSCWYTPSAAWGVAPYSGYQAGQANDPAEGTKGPVYPWANP
jgi:hypothetical protein